MCPNKEICVTKFSKGLLYFTTYVHTYSISVCVLCVGFYYIVVRARHLTVSFYCVFNRYSIRKDLDAAAESVSGSSMPPPPVSVMCSDTLLLYDCNSY